MSCTSGESVLVGERGRGGTRRDIDLAEDVAQVASDGLLAQQQGAAISGLVLPAATSRRTSTSRAVSPRGRWAGSSRRPPARRAGAQGRERAGRGRELGDRGLVVAERSQRAAEQDLRPGGVVGPASSPTWQRRAQQRQGVARVGRRREPARRRAWPAIAWSEADSNDAAIATSSATSGRAASRSSVGEEDLDRGRQQLGAVHGVAGLAEQPADGGDRGRRCGPAPATAAPARAGGRARSRPPAGTPPRRRRRSPRMRSTSPRLGHRQTRGGRGVGIPVARDREVELVEGLVERSAHPHDLSAVDRALARERHQPGCWSHQAVRADVHCAARPKSEISWQASIIEQ